MAFYQDSHAALPTELLQYLPFTSFEPVTIRKYLLQGIDFMAFCDARGMRLLPANYKALMAYFLEYFRRGNTTRTFSTLATRLKWFYEYILEEPWLEEMNPVEHRAFLKGRRGLAKLDDSKKDKARPLYARTLRMMFGVVKRSDFEEFQVLACLTLAHAAMQRLGEVTNGKARLPHVRCYESLGGRFFAFFYGQSNKPKNFKIGQTPYAMVSEKTNPFAYKVLEVYLRKMFGGFRVFQGEEGWEWVGGRKGVFTGCSSRNVEVCLFPSLVGGANDHSKGLKMERTIKIMRRLLRRARIPYPEEYSGQSCRRGGRADRFHVPVQLVRVQGHWAPGSKVVDQEYSVHSIQLRLRYF